MILKLASHYHTAILLHHTHLLVIIQHLPHSNTSYHLHVVMFPGQKQIVTKHNNHELSTPNQEPTHSIHCKVVKTGERSVPPGLIVCPVTDWLMVRCDVMPHPSSHQPPPRQATTGHCPLVRSTNTNSAYLMVKLHLQLMQGLFLVLVLEPPPPTLTYLIELPLARKKRVK